MTEWQEIGRLDISSQTFCLNNSSTDKDFIIDHGGVRVFWIYRKNEETGFHATNFPPFVFLFDEISAIPCEYDQFPKEISNLISVELVNIRYTLLHGYYKLVERVKIIQYSSQFVIFIRILYYIILLTIVSLPYLITYPFSFPHGYVTFQMEFSQN